jgi:hypothetical protein
VPIEKKMIPVAPFKGLYLDGVTIPGGLSKAENVIFLPDGTAERRPFERTLADTETCQASRGTKEVFELLKNDGTRYIYADIDNSETYTSAFGAEEVEHFATWTPTSGWTYGGSPGKWTHSAGTTALVATSETAIVAATKYRVVLDVTFPTIYGSSTAGKWTYASADSGQTWTTETGSTEIIWLATWTHASGATTALNASEDFDVVAGQSYVVKLYVTHTSGTGLSVYLGGDLLGTITSSGYHTYIARYVTNTTGLRLVPSSDWVGSIEKTSPRIPSKIDKWCSVVKLITPDAANIPANYDYTESTHEPKSIYLNGAELLYRIPVYWYAEVGSSVSQSVSVSIGGAAGTELITESGVYSFDITATNTTALTITPTTAFTGDINSASVKKMTQAAAATRCKVIGGLVTGTTDYEVTWAKILGRLSSGDTVHPQWAALQDRAFRVDGTNPNYWFEDATYYHTLGVPSPADAPVTASTTGGEITAGDYNVYYTYVKKYSDNYTVEGNPSPASPVTVAGSAITVTVVACTDLDVTHIRIYRTLYGESGSYAYRCEEVKNATATITITLSDDSIRDTLSTLEFNHDVPPLGKFVLGAGSRLWIVDTDGTLHWSVLDQPELMPAMNYQTFDPKDGDVMMGLCPLRKNILVFKRRRTWLLDQFSESVSDDGTAALAKDVVSSTYGCVATGSIQPVGTDAAIWLSHAGFILYNGGSIKNISGGGIDADGNMMPSRIQDVINNFMADGAEHFIDSAYHTARQLYHVNFLTRNAAGDEITEQRHFVYNLQSDSWSEYVYRNTSGTKMYETNFAMAHDSLGNEVILIPYIVSTTGTVTYVYQGEYDKAPTATIDYSEILTAAGADGTASDKPLMAILDGSDNVYIQEYSDIFKVTSAGAKSLLISNATLKTLVGTEISNLSALMINEIVSDIDRNFFYIRGGGVTTGRADWFSYIVQSDLSGNCVLIATRSYTNPDLGCKFQIGNLIEHCAVGSDGTLFYVNRQMLGNELDYDTPRTLRIVTTPGATQTDALYYSFGSVMAAGDDLYRFSRYGDNLYYICYDAAISGGNYIIAKFTDITGTASVSYIDTGIEANINNVFAGIIAASDIKLYMIYETTGYYKVLEFSYSNSSWDSTEVISLAVSGVTHGYSSFVMNTEGEIIISPQNTIYWYASDFSLKTTIAISGLTGAVGVAHLIGTSTDEQTIIVCGYTSDNVYKISPVSVILADDEPTMKNTIAHIVSNYNDLGMSQDKRISRAYLDVDAKYPGCGSFSLEPSYEVNYYTHSFGESSQPSGSVSMRPWYHPGHQTWVYTNSAFDSDVEQWLPLRLDVGMKGNKFRYAIRAGDVATNVSGTMRIRPPKLMVQVKELP